MNHIIDVLSMNGPSQDNVFCKKSKESTKDDQVMVPNDTLAPKLFKMEFSKRVSNRV